MSGITQWFFKIGTLLELTCGKSKLIVTYYLLVQVLNHPASTLIESNSFLKTRISVISVQILVSAESSLGILEKIEHSSALPNTK